MGVNGSLENRSMARPTRGHGHDRRGPIPKKNKWSSTSETCMGQKSVENLIIKAAEAYPEGTHAGIRKLLE